LNDARTIDVEAAHAVSEEDMANGLRLLAMDAVQKADSGHPGMPLGMADVATVLFSRFIRIDPGNPCWPDRDRFVLSAGHGSMLQYALHHLVGYPDMPLEELTRFRQLGAKTAGHPEYGHALGIETTTGPLGQGLATAVGMAIAERMLESRYGPELVDHHTYVMAGDGCLAEGISQEAIDLAGHLQLSRLIVLWDDNRISIDGPTSLSTSTDQAARFRAAGWEVSKIDGHDYGRIAEAILMARQSARPSLIACRTTIGKGAPNLEGSEKTHGAPLGAAVIAAAKERIGWSKAPFEIPDVVRAAWTSVAVRGQRARAEWEERLAASPARDAFLRQLDGGLSDELGKALADFRRTNLKAATRVATRKASQMVLAEVNAAIGLTVGGSADLTHSNLTLTPGLKPISAADFSGRYIHYEIREHGMAAAMNGIALHGGFIPYGGTFLVFSDYARGAMRLSALMGQRVIYVLTHDSIGLGEDGPTHQPIEHLAMLRATPNLNVFRPADVIETAECWELALRSSDRPSVLVLSRQQLPMLRENGTTANLSATGAYVLHEPDRLRDLTILATGSEVEIARAAAATLAERHGLAAAVVSMPCWELFEKQPERVRSAILGQALRIGIEAAARMGWDRWIGEDGAFIGMTGFGASAPAAELYRHFGITREALVETATRLIARRPG
jgi:transketolase